MASIDDLVASIDGDVAAGNGLAGQVEASRAMAEQLTGVLMGLAVEGVAAQVDLCRRELEAALGLQRALVAKLEEARAAAELARTI
ncbi:hypothetical protein LX16_4417 [Stackebrandtia albiflava]|uniref:Uncharacterized protein n=1 Tax=Stackebrandtia albiflava TaxID=406432 RepID=A0A562URF8_9ACTN|nr:hypothetical protein [Stackebrandtia albiflava]TWJ08196.1 hypothetical protein LX16_4417 [Stackebrandtia albiflava]